MGNSNISSSDTLVPTIDFDNPLYCPSMPAASYLHSIRGQLGLSSSLRWREPPKPILSKNKNTLETGSSSTFRRSGDSTFSITNMQLYNISSLTSSNIINNSKNPKKKLVSDSGIRKRRSSAHIFKQKENEVEFEGKARKSQGLGGGKGGTVSSFARSLGQAILQMEKEKARKRQDLMQTQEERRDASLAERREKQKEEKEEEKASKKHQDKKNRKKRKLNTATVTRDGEGEAKDIDDEDCRDFGTPPVEHGIAHERNAPRSAGGTGLRRKAGTRPIRKTRKDKAAAAATHAVNDNIPPSRAAIQSVTFYPPQLETNPIVINPNPVLDFGSRPNPLLGLEDFNFDFEIPPVVTGVGDVSFSLPPLPPIPISSPSFLGYDLEDGMRASSHRIGGAPLRTSTPFGGAVGMVEVTKEPSFLPSPEPSPKVGAEMKNVGDQDPGLGLGSEIRLISRFSDSNIFDAEEEDTGEGLGIGVGNDTSMMSPVVLVQARARARAKRMEMGGVTSSRASGESDDLDLKEAEMLIGEREEKRQGRGYGVAEELRRKRRLEEAFPKLLCGPGIYRRSFVGSPAAGAGTGGNRKDDGGGCESVSGYADADRETERLLGAMPDIGDLGDQEEEDDDDDDEEETLISELEELRREKELEGREAIRLDWRELERKRQKKTGFPPRSYPALAGYVYSPPHVLLPFGPGDEDVVVASGDEADDKEKRVRELEDELYGPPIGTETPRGYRALVSRLDRLMPGLRLVQRLGEGPDTLGWTGNDTSMRDAARGGLRQKSHQGVVDFLGKEGLLNERVMEVFRSSEVRKIVLGASMSDEGGLNLGGRGVLDVLDKPNSFMFLTEIDFGGTKLEDGDLVKIGRLPKLISVGLDQTGIGNEGIFNLVPLKQTLLRLSIAMNPDVDDDAVPALVVLHKLSKLCIIDTGIGMGGLRRMAKVIDEEGRVIDVEIPARCEEYVESIPTRYVLYPQPPLIALPAMCAKLSAGALKRNLEAHKSVNGSILAGGTKEEMRERLQEILRIREMDMVVWGMVFGHGE